MGYFTIPSMQRMGILAMGGTEKIEMSPIMMKVPIMMIVPMIKTILMTMNCLTI